MPGRQIAIPSTNTLSMPGIFVMRRIFVMRHIFAILGIFVTPCN